jgi:predicted phosphodiesterase
MLELLEKLKKKFEIEPPVIFDNAEKLLFIGDVHGDLSTIEYAKKVVENYERIIFLGDFVDRGENQVEVVEEITRLKIENDKIVLLAGNHDAYLDVWPRDFPQKLKENFDNWKEIEHAYLRAFQGAPIAYLNKRHRLLAVHGCIPFEEKYWDLSKWQKVKENNIAYQILWNDPEITFSGWRGPGIYAIPNEKIIKFLEQNGLEALIRSHQPRINKVFTLDGKKLANIGSSYLYGIKAVLEVPGFKLKFI